MGEVANSENENTQKIMKDVDKPELSDEEMTKLQKTIKIENLRHPGGWIHNPQIQRMLCRSQNFSTKFSRSPESSERHIKFGNIEIEFSTVDVARDAYVILQKIMVDGAKLVVKVDPVFFAAASSVPTSSYFSPSNDPLIRNCTIYALYLPRSSDKTLLECIIGTGVINDFRMLPMPSQEGLIQAQIIVIDEETASTIIADAEDFPIDDGEQQTTAKLMNPDEYLSLVKSETAAKPFVVVSNGKDKETEDGEDTVVEVRAEEVLAPEINENEVLQKLEKFIEDERINFAEINEKHELYALIDSVSAGYGGLPDSMLKPIMLTALQRCLNRTEMHWLREHLEGLIRQWKNEVMSEAFFDRSTVVRMEPVAYKPEIVEEKKKKGTQKRAKAAKALMGVGAFLTQNRDRLILDEGEVDLDEDDDGNVLLGGEKLSFESWAKKTKTKGSGVVRALDDGSKKIGTGGFSKKQLRMARTVEGMSQDDYKKWRKEKNENRRTEIKERIMTRGAMTQEDEVEEKVEKENGTAEEKKPPKELDEGEIDSDEERKEEKKSNKKASKKRKRDSSDSDTSSSSSSSSSSSDDNADGEATGSRQRRTKRRIKDRKRGGRSGGIQPKISPVFKSMFDNRKAIIANMTPAHKLAFANVLNQIRQSNAPINQTQATQMMNAMFNNGGGFK